MTPREKAEACYRLARSTEHAGERDNAIGRGDAICDKHGLDKATFDVPGRAKPKVEARFERAQYSYARTHEYGARQRKEPQFTADDIFAAFNRNRNEWGDLGDALRRYAEAAGIDAAEVERARQARAAREAQKRQAELHRQHSEAMQAADMLLKRGFVVVAAKGPFIAGLSDWEVTYRGRTEIANDVQLVALWNKVKDREAEQADGRQRAEDLRRWAAEGVHFTFDEGFAEGEE